MKAILERLTKTTLIIVLLCMLFLTVFLVGCDSNTSTDDSILENPLDTTQQSADKKLIEQKIEQFTACYNKGDMDELAECFDATTREAFVALIDLFGGIVDLGDIFALEIYSFDGQAFQAIIQNISITEGKALVTTKSNIQGSGDDTLFFVMVYENDEWCINNMTNDIPEDMPIYNNDGVPTYTVSTVSYAINENAGTFTKLTHEQHMVGDEVKLSARSSDGYTFDGWYLNGSLLSTEEEYTYTVESKNVTLEARFVYYFLNTYSYTDEYGIAGSFTKYLVEKISAGKSVCLEASVNDGYIFEGWFSNDICVSNDLTYTFIMPKEDVELEARFKYNLHSLTVEGDDLLGEAGTYTAINKKMLSTGESILLKATVNSGYNFKGWYSNGNCLSQETTYEYIMGGEDVLIEALFNYNTLNVYGYCADAPLEYAGSCTEIYDEKVSIGNVVAIVATVNEGYIFEGWFNNDICISTDLEFEYVMNDESVEIVGIFKRNN